MNTVAFPGCGRSRDHIQVAVYGKLKMQCLYVAGTMTRLSVCLGELSAYDLWEVKNAVFVCGWDLDLVSA